MQETSRFVRRLKNVVYIFLVDTFFSFHVQIRNNCDGCPTPYQISNCSRRLLLKCAKRTGEFYRSSTVKWFSSMPRNSSIMVNLNFLLVLRNHCLYNPIFGAVFKKHIFPIPCSLKYSSKRFWKVEGWKTGFSLGSSFTAMQKSATVRENHASTSSTTGNHITVVAVIIPPSIHSLKRHVNSDWTTERS